MTGSLWQDLKSPRISAKLDKEITEGDKIRSMKFLLTLWLSKLICRAVNLIDQKRGSNYSGMIATKLMPDFVGHFHGIDYDKVIFVTGTNGKSTTTNLVNHTLLSAGKTVACNVEGANMMGGVATALIKNSTLSGKLNKEYMVLEIDERSLPAIRKVLPGHHMGITNLQKDQVQRNGDPDFIFRKFQSAIGVDMTLYLNNEEPRSKALEDQAGRSIYFSVAENEKTYEKHDSYAVTLPCPKCAHPIVYHRYNLASIGPFSCSHCGHSSSEQPDVLISQVDFEKNTFRCGDTDFKITYNNPFYIYNYAMDIAICKNLGLTDAEIQKAFESFVNPATHISCYQYHGKEVHYVQGKQENPEALQSQMDVIAADKRPKAVFVGMHEIRDFPPHYSGSFYFFDCDFAPIVDSNVKYYVSFSTTVCHDLASRMIFAGADQERVTVMDTNDIAAVTAKLDEMDVGVAYFLTNTACCKEISSYLSAQGGTTNG